jgi:tRNA1Val (adenine37-N6)-methyltransferase
MPNNYFQFKEFKIEQDTCSMKVCTDACLFGAWLAEKIKAGKLPVKNCLDIGTGTGLLPLMIAQKNQDIIIDAVELEEGAYQQAKQNFINSKWNSRLNIIHTDAKKFAATKKYHLIITNPPFYENELLSAERNKNLAKHDEGLRLKDLIRVIKDHLDDSGYFAILLPWHRIKYFEELAAENNFFPMEKLLVRQTPAHDFFRGILFYTRMQDEVKVNELTIKNTQGNYTPAFAGLLKDYYLNL